MPSLAATPISAGLTLGSKFNSASTFFFSSRSVIDIAPFTFNFNRSCQVFKDRRTFQKQQFRNSTPLFANWRARRWRARDTRDFAVFLLTPAYSFSESWSADRRSRG